MNTEDWWTAEDNWFWIAELLNEVRHLRIELDWWKAAAGG